MIEYEDSQNKSHYSNGGSPLCKSLSWVRLCGKIRGKLYGFPDSAVRSRVAQDLVFLNFVGIKVVVVHGGGKAVTKELANGGLEATFIDGLRVTDEKTIEVVDQILNQKVNGEVAEFVSSFDCNVQKLPGKEILHCQKLEEEHDLGFVGSITIR